MIINSGTVNIADASTLNKNYGNVVTIEHSNGFVSLYAHLAMINVTKGQIVNAGDIIGTVGETGKATGPHLHLELVKDNVHVDPLSYLPY